MKKLEGKVAIITGGAGGIGSATARVLLTEGAKVMLVGRTEKSLIKACKDMSNYDVEYCVADVSNAQDTQHYVKKTLDIFGKIDVLFSNAGVEGVVKPIAETQFILDQ